MKIISDNKDKSFLELRQALCPYTEKVEAERCRAVRDNPHFLAKVPLIGYVINEHRFKVSTEIGKWTLGIGNTLKSMGHSDPLDSARQRIWDILETLDKTPEENLESALAELADSAKEFVQEYKKVVEFGALHYRKEGEDPRTARARIASQQFGWRTPDFSEHPEPSLYQRPAALGYSYEALFAQGQKLIPEHKKQDFMIEGTALNELRKARNELCEYFAEMDQSALDKRFIKHFQKHESAEWRRCYDTWPT